MVVGAFMWSLFVCACLFLCVYMSLVCGGIGVWGVCLSSGRFVRTHLFSVSTIRLVACLVGWLVGWLCIVLAHITFAHSMRTPCADLHLGVEFVSVVSFSCMCVCDNEDMGVACWHPRSLREMSE